MAGIGTMIIGSTFFVSYSNLWHSILEVFPIDGSIVWIRVPYFYDHPEKATFDLTTQTFTGLDTGLVIPAYIITRWKML